jgi:flagellar biogenesis protein FliO
MQGITMIQLILVLTLIITKAWLLGAMPAENNVSN